MQQKTLCTFVGRLGAPFKLREIQNDKLKGERNRYVASTTMAVDLGNDRVLWVDVRKWINVHNEDEARESELWKRLQRYTPKDLIRFQGLPVLRAYINDDKQPIARLTLDLQSGEVLQRSEEAEPQF